MTSPVQRAVLITGGVTKLAKEVNVTPPAVSQWISGIRRVPAERCPAIERATGGAVRCEDLRPDVDWGVLRCPNAMTGTALPEGVTDEA